MYFIPDIDETQGYYDAAAGVSSSIRQIAELALIVVSSGGLIGAVLLMACSAGSLLGQQ